VGGFGPSPSGARQNPKSTILVDNIPYVWYNKGMRKMSEFPDLIKWGTLTKFFSGIHYEGEKIIQEFADITKAPKKVRSFL
jgi:hypothetical protein